MMPPLLTGGSIDQLVLDLVARVAVVVHLRVLVALPHPSAGSFIVVALQVHLLLVAPTARVFGALFAGRAGRVRVEDGVLLNLVRDEAAHRRQLPATGGGGRWWCR